MHPFVSQCIFSCISIGARGHALVTFDLKTNLSKAQETHVAEILVYKIANCIEMVTVK